MWTTNNIPDLTDKVTVITGANSGVGYETAYALAVKGATVIMACRNLEKGKAAIQQIKAKLPQAKLELLLLNLADLASVRSFGKEFTNRHSQLNILVNNAGVMALPKRYQTADGFEMQFGTNHLGHFALTGVLLPVLQNTPNARIVTVSSTAHQTGKIDFNNLNAEKSYSKFGAYSLSKLANLLFTYELQRRLTTAGHNIIAVAVHPGYAATNLQKTSAIFSFLNKFLAQDQKMGALPTLYGATAPNVQGGDYFGPSGFMEMWGYPKKVKSNQASYNKTVAKQLWKVSEELTNIHYNLLPPNQTVL